MLTMLCVVASSACKICRSFLSSLAILASYWRHASWNFIQLSTSGASSARRASSLPGHLCDVQGVFEMQIVTQALVT